MAILINDMEMPETCEYCPFHVYHSHGEYVCKATPLLYPMNLANSKGIRKNWCPLVETPEPCEDAVSRKAVEEMLKNGFPARGMWEIEGDVVKQTVCETLVDALMDLEKLPSVTPSAQQWIPRSERLPEDGRYLVTRFDFVTNTCFLDILWYEKGVWWNRLYTGDFAVIAWMPLPESYKGDRDGE